MLTLKVEEVDMNRDNEQMAQPRASLRLIFEYEGDQIRLVSQQETDVEPPLSDPKTAPAEQAGFWLEVRDAKLRVLHRQIMYDPVMTHPEVFSDQSGKNIVRSETPMRKGAFTVLVPRMATSDHLAFIRINPQIRARAERKLVGGAPVGEIARFPLKVQPTPASKEGKK